MLGIVACENSATVRDAFRKQGADFWSCDLLPTSGDPAYHIIGDALDVLSSRKWDVIIAHPPCTYLCNSGVHHIYDKTSKDVDYDRVNNMLKGAEFFLRFLNADARFICVENPIQHKHAQKVIKTKPTQIIQPWMFGHPESKATCLWLKGLPNLQPTTRFCGAEQRIHKLPPSQDRWKERSKTYQGIADAMASQWIPWIKRWLN